MLKIYGLKDYDFGFPFDPRTLPTVMFLTISIIGACSKVSLDLLYKGWETQFLIVGMYICCLDVI